MAKDELIGIQFEGVCHSLSYLGLGEAKLENNMVFVPNLYPNEKAIIEISYKRNGQYFGRIIELLEKSHDRIESQCPYFKECGGCSFQDYSYEAEKVFKTNLIKDQLHKVADIDIDPLPVIGMGNPRFYRNKIQLHFGLDGKNIPILGFYKEGSHKVMPIKRCLIEDPRGGEIANKILSAVKELGISVYNEETHQGELRHLLIRTSHSNEQILCVLVTKNPKFPTKAELIQKIKSLCPEITTLVQSINGKRTNVILGDKEDILYGPGYIEDSLCGLSFKISAKSFYQVNPIMTEILYSKAMEFADLKPTDVVFDAYSGIGTIGLIASKHVKEVISVELVPEAVLDAKENAKRNGISNFNEYEGDATEFIKRLAKENKHIDVLFMDPPRKGSTPEFIEAVKKLESDRVVYISCGPSSLARDLKLFDSEYKIKSVQPTDLFPRTVHVETIALLCLKK